MNKFHLLGIFCACLALDTPVTKASDDDYRGGTGVIMDRLSKLWRKNTWGVKPSLAMEQGVTLIELMVGIVVALVVVVAGFTILTTSQKSTQAND